MKQLVWMGFSLVLSAVAPAEDQRLARLSPEHRHWLEEEVVYFTLEREREVFLSLETLEERERFIEAFWRKRDPNPATPQNEFKEELYRRIEYVNTAFAREAPQPGWTTDRGQMYITLGKPRSVERFEGYSDIVSSELWSYDGDVTKGLPSFFYLLFFRRNNIGEYRLYHPAVDGPAALRAAMGGPSSGNLVETLAVLNRVSPALARASLSLDPADPADFVHGQPSLGTDFLMTKIYESTRRSIRTDYVDAWQRYGKKVAVEYSFNYVPSRSVFAVLAGPENKPFVHYSIEIDPGNFTLETDDDGSKFYTTLDVSLEVADRAGVLVMGSENEAYLELTPSQLQQVLVSSFAYQANFPLVPGDYQVNVILRNRVSRQYAVAEQDLRVDPIPSDRPALSDIVVGFRAELTSETVNVGELRTFQIGNLLMHPSGDAVFAIGDTVHVFFQVLGADPDCQLHFALLNGEEIAQQRSTRVSDYDGGPIMEQFRLTKMAGGNYVLRVQLADPSGNVVAEKLARLAVSPRSSVVRPWTYRRSFNTREPGRIALARGEQFLALKRYQDARLELEIAAASREVELTSARWRLAGLLIQAGETDRALELLRPLEKDYPNQYEVQAGLGIALYLENDLSQAVFYLERAVGIRPPDPSVLNALGDSYQRLGNFLKAKEFFQRSLELSPDQGAIRERLAALEKSQ